LEYIDKKKEMPTNTKVENNLGLQNSNPSLIRVVLAESILSEIALIKMSLINMPHIVITTVRTYEQLLKSIVENQPELVFLGNIDITNYFEICRECKHIRPELPIFLISKQEITNDSFRQAIQSYGITDIICSNNFTKLDELFHEFDANRQLIHESPLQPTITGRMMLEGFAEIITVSNNFFGPLAQGNYWRKAHNQLVDQFPFLQNWASDHFSKITCSQDILDLELTKENIQCLQKWVHFFIQECERIIVDFRDILATSNCSPTTQNLLIKSPS
jgi:hypothetical protein